MAAGGGGGGAPTLRLLQVRVHVASLVGGGGTCRVGLRSWACGGRPTDKLALPSALTEPTTRLNYHSLNKKKLSTRFKPIQGACLGVYSSPRCYLNGLGRQLPAVHSSNCCFTSTPSRRQVKCVGGLPCERCWVLNLPCRLRQRQRRMPTAKRRKGEDADAAREVLAAAMGGPSVALVLATANVKANAEAYLQAFHKVSAMGLTEAPAARRSASWHPIRGSPSALTPFHKMPRSVAAAERGPGHSGACGRPAVRIRRPGTTTWAHPPPHDTLNKPVPRGCLISNRSAATKPGRRYYRKMALVVGTDISWGIVEVRSCGCIAALYAF